jgi:hypothetical protein
MSSPATPASSQKFMNAWDRMRGRRNSRCLPSDDEITATHTHNGARTQATAKVSDPEVWVSTRDTIATTATTKATYAIQDRRIMSELDRNGQEKVSSKVPATYAGGDFFRNPVRSNSTLSTMGVGFSLRGEVSLRGTADRGGGSTMSDTVSTSRSSVSDCTFEPSVTRDTCIRQRAHQYSANRQVAQSTAERELWQQIPTSDPLQ